MLLGEAIGRYAIGEFAASSAAAVTASVGTFTLTFQSVSSQVGLAAEYGTFTLSGQDSGLVVTMPADYGSFTLSGQAASLNSVIVMTATPFIDGARIQIGLSALGEAAIGQLGEPSQRTFTIAFKSAESLFTMPADSGTFTLSGQLASTFVGTILNPVTGSYTLTGYDAVFQTNMPAASGTFAFTGNVVEFINRRPRIRAFPRVGNPTFSGKTLGRGFKARAYG